MTVRTRQVDTCNRRNPLHGFKQSTAWLCTLLLTTATLAQDPTARQDSAIQDPKIIALIQQLDSDDFARRERAMESLRATGKAAKPHLVNALKAASLELRLRIEELLSHLPDGETADHEARIQERVSVTLTDATLEEALKAVAKDSGVTILPNGMKFDRPISLSFKDASFFEAVDALADAVNASWHMDGRSSTIRLVAAGVNTPHRVYSGSVRIAAERFMNNRSLSYGGQSIGSCYLQLRIDVEPSAHFIGLWQPLQAMTITDDKGQSLSLPPSRTARFQSVSGRSTHSFTIPMLTPPSGAKTIALLEGSIEIAFPKSYERVTLPLPEPGVTPDPDSSESVRIQSVSPRDAPRRVVVIEATRRPLQIDGIVNIQVQDRRAAFLLSDGTRVDAGILPHPRRQGDKEIFTLILPDGEVESVQFERLTAIRTEKVRFQLRDLPLP